MRILSVDTATTSCSVAITEGPTSLSEVTNDIGQTHAKHLMGMIQSATELAGVGISDIDGFAVARGPGSFTGLRIGIATVKGLAAATGKPVAGVSTLSALAMQVAGTSMAICPLIDARRGEVYHCRYRYGEGGLKSLGEEAVAAPDEAIRDLKEPTLFVGGGARLYRELLADTLGESARFAPVIQDTIRASTIGLLGLEAFRAGLEENAADVVPVYIRRSDAEINRDRTAP